MDDTAAHTSAPPNCRTHNGKITIENTVTGQHRTFSIATVMTEDSPLQGKRIISLLIGSNNESDYKGFAFVDEKGVHVWKRMRGTDGQLSEYEKYARMLEHPERYERKGCVYHIEGHCRVCNRLLTVPESIQTGIGPVCAGRAPVARPAAGIAETTETTGIAGKVRDIQQHLLSHTGEPSRLMTEHSALSWPVSEWPLMVRLVGDSEPKEFARANRFLQGHGEDQDLGGYDYVSADGWTLTIFND
jgi:hypothetical protein